MSVNAKSLEPFLNLLEQCKDLDENTDFQIGDGRSLVKAKLTANAVERTFGFTDHVKQTCKANNDVRQMLLNAVKEHFNAKSFAALRPEVRAAFKGRKVKLLGDGADLALDKDDNVTSGRPLSLRRIREVVEAAIKYSSEEPGQEAGNTGSKIENAGQNEVKVSSQPNHPMNDDASTLASLKDMLKLYCDQYQKEFCPKSSFNVNDLYARMEQESPHLSLEGLENKLTEGKLPDYNLFPSFDPDTASPEEQSAILVMRNILQAIFILEHKQVLKDGCSNPLVSAKDMETYLVKVIGVEVHASNAQLSHSLEDVRRKHKEMPPDVQEILSNQNLKNDDDKLRAIWDWEKKNYTLSTLVSYAQLLADAQGKIKTLGENQKTKEIMEIFKATQGVCIEIRCENVTNTLFQTEDNEKESILETTSNIMAEVKEKSAGTMRNVLALYAGRLCLHGNNEGLAEEGKDSGFVWLDDKEMDSGQDQAIIEMLKKETWQLNEYLKGLNADQLFEMLLHCYEHRPANKKVEIEKQGVINECMSLMQKEFAAKLAGKLLGRNRYLVYLEPPKGQLGGENWVAKSSVNVLQKVTYPYLVNQAKSLFLYEAYAVTDNGNVSHESTNDVDERAEGNGGQNDDYRAEVGKVATEVLNSKDKMEQFIDEIKEDLADKQLGELHPKEPNPEVEQGRMKLSKEELKELVMTQLQRLGDSDRQYETEDLLYIDKEFRQLLTHRERLRRIVAGRIRLSPKETPKRIQNHIHNEAFKIARFVYKDTTLSTETLGSPRAGNYINLGKYTVFGLAEYLEDEIRVICNKALAGNSVANDFCKKWFDENGFFKEMPDFESAIVKNFDQNRVPDFIKEVLSARLRIKEKERE